MVSKLKGWKAEVVRRVDRRPQVVRNGVVLSSVAVVVDEGFVCGGCNLLVLYLWWAPDHSSVKPPAWLFLSSPSRGTDRLSWQSLKIMKHVLQTTYHPLTTATSLSKLLLP